jgi:cysteine desulfurase family protein (TIGR01976 family)
MTAVVGAKFRLSSPPMSTPAPEPPSALSPADPSASEAVLDLAWAREQFPSLGLRVGGRPVAYFDNPAGTQVPRHVERAVLEYFAQANANTHGPFLTSQRTDAVVERARLLAAALLGAGSASEIVFGANMTTLTLAFSRALSSELRSGDEVIVSDLDHDANISPWLELEERGVVVRRIPIARERGALDLLAFERLLGERTRLVAVGYASNALGTINDVQRIAELSHRAGAWVWVDAVHIAPHRLIDVCCLGVDFLVCSAYKFFGPHVGVLWGRAELLERLPSRRIRPAPDTAPDKFESGTKNHEGLAGLSGALTYLAELGAGPGHASPFGEGPLSIERARVPLAVALSAIAAHEAGLSRQLIAGLGGIRGLRLYGVRDPGALAERVPTFAFTLAGLSNELVARRLAEQGIFAWAGHHYAPTLMDRLELGEEGVVRVGAVHYNSAEEVSRLVEALELMAC